jgi:hypothetical protein
MRQGEEACTERRSQLDAGAVRQELRVAGADARFSRSSQCCKYRTERRAETEGPRAEAPLEVSGEDDPRLRSLHLPTPQWASAQAESPVRAPLLPELVLAPAPRLQQRARLQHDDDAELARHHLQWQALASAQAAAPRRCRAVSWLQPPGQRLVRAFRAPIGRECERLDHHSRDSDGCEQERPSDEGG